jgi:hypothetical protein
MTTLERFDVLNKFIALHGIKPRNTEIINIDDSLNEMIGKFNQWYDRVLECGMQGHYMDVKGFEDIINDFKISFYPTFIQDKEIEFDDFIQHLLYSVTSGNKGYKYIFPSLIINIINVELYDDILKLIITNMNQDDLHDLEINIKLKTTNLYKIVFDKLCVQYKLYELDQLKLIYKDQLILKNKNLVDEFADVYTF